MGSGIAQVCAQAGYTVTMRDITGEILEKSLKTIRWSVGKFVEKGKLDGTVDDIMERLKVTTDLADAADADFVFEAIIENLEATKAFLRTAEADAAVDEWGVMSPAAMPLMVARQLFIRMYPRMAEILHLLGSSSLMALPTEADLAGPLAPDIERYLETDTATAQERVRLFRLAWDTCCSAFASRQVLYERFFQGDRSRNVVLLNELYDKAPMTNWVREFLED